MAYTVARTWVTAETVTAALMNTHVRDNLAATAPGIASATGNLIVTSGTNAVAERTPAQDTDGGSGSLTNTSFLSLANLTGGTPFGGEVEVAVTTGTTARVFWGANIQNDTAGGQVIVSYSVSGATTSAATDNRSLSFESNAGGDFAQFSTFLRLAVNAGSNTFTMEARVPSHTGTINDPRLLVIPL